MWWGHLFLFGSASTIPSPSLTTSSSQRDLDLGPGPEKGRVGDEEGMCTSTPSPGTCGPTGRSDNSSSKRRPGVRLPRHHSLDEVRGSVSPTEGTSGRWRVPGRGTDVLDREEDTVEGPSRLFSRDTTDVGVFLTRLLLDFVSLSDIGWGVLRSLCGRRRDPVGTPVD